MPEPRPGVLFDVDGTLLDTNYLHVLAWWQAFRDVGHGPVPMDRIHRAIGIPSEGLVRQVLGGTPDDDTVEPVVEAHTTRYEALRDDVEPFPRTADLLHACADRGLTVVLATSGKAADLDWMQPAIGAEDAVAGATTSEDVDAGKPEPDLLTTAIRDHGLDPRRTVVVGDTVWDVEAARKAGLPCVALTCGGIGVQELTDAGAEAVYADPAELLDHLDDSPLGRIAAG
jgi:HAD superfamily hydrolase (TIGR01509 family)